MKTTFIVMGFHCPSCEALVKDVVEDFPEIKSCSVNVKSGKIVLEHASTFNVEKFKNEIEGLGDYKVRS